MGDLVPYCMPDFSKCGPAASDIGPALGEAIEYFTSQKWLSCEETGTKTFVQEPMCICWHNVPLCVGMWCIPCCSCAVLPRNLEAMNDEKSCESNALVCCVLSFLCCANACWMAKKRGEFRKKYDLKGSDGIDCLGACCFNPCVVCTDANQLMTETDYTVPYAALPK